MDKNFIALEAAICPVCGEQHTYECGILVDNKFEDRFADKYVVTGYKLCEKHEKLINDNYIFLIGIDPTKSKIQNEHSNIEDVYRTGKVLAVNRKVAKQIFIEDTITDNNSIYYVHDELINDLIEEFKGKIAYEDTEKIS